MSGFTGGFNKIIRNIVAGASDTEFEKVLPLNITSAATNKMHVPPRQQRTQRKARYL
jgi:hypothetical protein